MWEERGRGRVEVESRSNIYPGFCEWLFSVELVIPFLLLVLL